MTRKNVEPSAHFKMVIAGVLTGLPLLMVLAGVYSVGTVVLPRWGVWLTLGGITLLLISIGLGLWRDWLLPGKPQQSAKAQVWRRGLALTGVISFSLASCLGMMLFNNRLATGNDAVGHKLYFVHEETYFAVQLLAATCCLILWGLLLKALFHNHRESRILAGMLTFCLFLFPLTFIGTLAIDMRNIPEWQILKTVTGPDNYSYSILGEHPQTRRIRPTAIAQHNANNPIYTTLEIILYDTNDSHIALINGTKQADATVRQACEALLSKTAE